MQKRVLSQLVSQCGSYSCTLKTGQLSFHSPAEIPLPDPTGAWKLEQRHVRFTSRDLALIAGLSGLYLAYGYVSGVTLGNTIGSLDLIFLIALLFTVVVGLTRRAWSATLFGTITGLILLGTPGAPSPAHIALPLIAGGFVFDLSIRLLGPESSRYRRNRIVAAGILGSFVMAPVGLAVLQVSGLPQLAIFWILAAVGNIVVGASGAFLGTVIFKRLGERATYRRIMRQP